MSTCAHARSYNIIHAQYFYYTTHISDATIIVIHDSYIMHNYCDT